MNLLNINKYSYVYYDKPPSETIKNIQLWENQTEIEFSKNKLSLTLHFNVTQKSILNRDPDIKNDEIKSLNQIKYNLLKKTRSWNFLFVPEENNMAMCYGENVFLFEYSAAGISTVGWTSFKLLFFMSGDHFDTP